MFRRTNTFCIFIMFLLTMTLPFFFFTVPARADGITYYVDNSRSDDSGTGISWDTAKKTIQSAIAVAENNDVIKIGSSDGHGTGIYTENIDVNKQLIIQSENGNSTTTIVASNSNDHVFEVTEDNVTIDGFSIYGATGMEKAGVYLVAVKNCTIKNNRCGWGASYKNTRGIHLDNSTDCVINSNTAKYNSGEGIYLNSSSSNDLNSNTVTNSTSDGIALTFSSSNTLTGNTANNNGCDGIRLVPASNNNILNNNTATDNGNNGILIVASSNNILTGNTANNNSATNGIYLVSSSNDNTLTNNTADNNVSNGIILESCSGNNLDSNTVTHNEFGIYLVSSSNNTITSNTMNENDGRWDGDGIMLNDNCSNNLISNNIMNNNPGDGIEFYNSSNNIVMGNTLDNGGLSDPGASMRINYYSSNNTIIDNTVINGAGGIVFEEGSNYNFASNNTVTGHSGRGFEFYENASYNTLAGNNISNNGTYGIWLKSGSYNTIYLNDVSNNTTSNIYSESTTTTWHSPNKVYYNYNSSNYYGYLGNYYSDGTHTGSNGIGGTYTIANDNNDNYQLIETSDNYLLPNSLPIITGLQDTISFRNDTTISINIWDVVSDSQTIDILLDYVFTTSNDSVIASYDSSAGILTLSSDISFLGFEQLTIEVADEYGSTTDSVIVKVVNSNKLPIIIGLQDIISFRNDTTISINIWDVVYDSQTSDSLLNYTFTTSNDSVIASYDSSAGILTLSSNISFFGFEQLIIEVADEYGSTTDSVIVEVINSNSLPIITGLQDTISFRNDTTISINIWDVVYDSQTADSLLNYTFTTSHDSVFTNYNINSGVLILSAGKYYSGISQLIIEVSDYFGTTKDSLIVEVTTYTGIIENEFPDKFALYQNYPNPFNPTTNIQFDLPKTADVKLIIYDIKGKKIRTLIDSQLNTGFKKIIWNGENDFGKKVVSGIYIYRIVSEKNIETMKMLFIK